MNAILYYTALYCPSSPPSSADAPASVNARRKLSTQQDELSRRINVLTLKIEALEERKAIAALHNELQQLRVPKNEPRRIPSEAKPTTHVAKLEPNQEPISATLKTTIAAPAIAAPAIAAPATCIEALQRILRNPGLTFHWGLGDFWYCTLDATPAFQTLGFGQQSSSSTLDTKGADREPYLTAFPLGNNPGRQSNPRQKGKEEAASRMLTMLLTGQMPPEHVWWPQDMVKQTEYGTQMFNPTYSWFTYRQQLLKPEYHLPYAVWHRVAIANTPSCAYKNWLHKVAPVSF